VQALENAAYRADKAFGSTPYRLDLLEFEPAHEGPDEQHSTAGPARRIDQRISQVA
jgi:hypothetical protein